LTTVRIPGERIGRTAARLIVERLASAGATVPRAERSVDLGFEIVRRESA